MSNPDPTLEESLAHQLNRVGDAAALDANNGGEDWRLLEQTINEAKAALLSLYQKELVRELKAIRADLPTGKPDNPTEFERASYMMATDLAEQINNRIKLTGEQP